MFRCLNLQWPWCHESFHSTLFCVCFLKNIHTGYLNLSKCINESVFRLQGVVDIVALQQEGHSFESWPEVFLHWVCMLSLCMCVFSLDTPASSHSPIKRLLVILMSLNHPWMLCECLYAWLSVLYIFVKDWWPVQGLSPLLPYDFWRQAPAPSSRCTDRWVYNGWKDI